MTLARDTVTPGPLLHALLFVSFTVEVAGVVRAERPAGQQAGFPAVYMTGFGVTASLIGRPEVGLLSMSEMVDAARRIVSVADVPVIADPDNGYGNAVNVIRTVREYEAAGVAAIQMEDQTAPKRCGHLAGKQVIPAEAMVDKIRAAVAARDNPNFTLIARTDARGRRTTVTPMGGAACSPEPYVNGRNRTPTR